MDPITILVMQGMSPENAAVVVQVKENVKLAQTLGACGFAICLWDTLAYVHVEYSVVWKAKWSFLKCAYLATRYVTILTGILYFIGFFASFSPSSCASYVKVLPAMGTLPLLGCSLVLLARAHTLWNGNRVLLGFMTFGICVQFIGMIVVSITETLPVVIGHGVKACVPTTKSDVFIIYWIVPAAVHLFITIVTFIKAWELTAINAHEVTIASRFKAVLFSRFGLVFPVCIMIVEVVQIVFYLTANSMQRAILSPLSGFLITVLACQMVLIYRLTSSSGMKGLASRQGKTSGSNQWLPSAPFSTGKLASGVKTHVTSHQRVDDEKEHYGSGSQPAGTAGAYACNRTSFIRPAQMVMPTVQRDLSANSMKDSAPEDDKDSFDEGIKVYTAQ